MKRPKIMVAHSSLFLRIMLTSELERLNFEVTATVKDSHEAMRECLELKPDIVVVDSTIAQANDFALIRAAQHTTSPQFIVTIPAQQASPEMVIAVVKAGADGYVEEPVEKRFTREDINSLFKKVGKDGRRYTTIPLHAPGETKNGATGQEWRGMKPLKGRHWRSEPRVLEQLDRDGLIE